jgi:hypothetical protein
MLVSQLSSRRSLAPSALALLSALLLGACLLGACDAEVPVEPEPEGPCDRALEPADPGPEPEGPLEVGFGHAPMPWRIGAKPGQVGTSSNGDLEPLYLRAVGEVYPIVRRHDTERMLDELTDWALGWLEERTAEVTPGRYHGVFDPSEALELPPDVRAVALRRGHREVVLVRADLYIMHEQLHRRVAALVERETGLARDQILLVGTHNHSVAHALSPAPGVWTRADTFDPRHFAYATRRIADAIIDAHRALEPAVLRVERRTFRDVQHNIIGQARVMAAPAEGEPQEEVSAGYPHDYFHDQLLVLRFDRPGAGGAPRDPLGFVFVLGMHPESLAEGHATLSGEWPLHVEARIAEETGVTSMWLPGPLGDVEPDRGRVNPEHVFMRAGWDPMHRMVDLITEAVLGAWDAAGEVPGDATPRLAQIARDVPGPADYPIPDLAEIGPRLPMVRVVQDSTLMRLHLVRIGDVLLAGIPAEVTTDLARAIETRVDREEGNAHQGYVWPDAPDWLRECIARNFTATELDATLGAPIPMVLSMSNGYFGYIVSRWEYENRRHYRQSMTAFGPGTADHVAGAVVALAQEMEGLAGACFPEQPWHDVDRAGAARIEAFLASLDPRVAELALAVPPSDPDQVGRVLDEPARDAETGALVFAWTGASNDLEPPDVRVEREEEGGTWTALHVGPGRALHVRYEAPDRWSAVWSGTAPPGSRVRFGVRGTYRGPTAGVSDPDPLFDPEGANRPYEVESTPWVIETDAAAP